MADYERVLEYLQMLRDARALEESIVSKLGGVDVKLPYMPYEQKGRPEFQNEYARSKSLQAQADGIYRNIQQRAYLMQTVLEGDGSPASAWNRGLGLLEVENTTIDVTLSDGSRVFESGPTTVTVLAPERGDRVCFIPLQEAKPFSDIVVVNEWTGQTIEVLPSEIKEIVLELGSKKNGFLWWSKILVTVRSFRLKCKFPGRGDGFRRRGLRGDESTWTAEIRILPSSEFWSVVDGLMYRLDCGPAIGGKMHRKRLQIEGGPSSEAQKDERDEELNRQYEELGYPICPKCNVQTRPATAEEKRFYDTLGSLARMPGTIVWQCPNCNNGGVRPAK